MPTRPEAEPQESQLVTSEEALLRGTGRGSDHWFMLLDAWGAKKRRHADVARWLQDEHGLSGWWAQSLTVGYERARGLRARHQISTGFGISVTRTVNVDAGRLLQAFTDARLRRRWAPDASMRTRPTRAALSARFDWSDPPSVVIATVVAKGSAKASVDVEHERLPDLDAAERLKGEWRERLARLKAFLEDES